MACHYDGRENEGISKSGGRINRIKSATLWSTWNSRSIPFFPSLLHCTELCCEVLTRLMIAAQQSMTVSKEKRTRSRSIRCCLVFSSTLLYRILCIAIRGFDIIMRVQQLESRLEACQHVLFGHGSVAFIRPRITHGLKFGADHPNRLGTPSTFFVGDVRISKQSPTCSFQRDRNIQYRDRDKQFHQRRKALLDVDVFG
mmetsp:Transcript_18363/g.50964  ORF Transcript_18363/g.50964 Transcript_18363/m.50964 type:complete len:199 (+) Transcript_18363:761-1357(+)